MKNERRSTVKLAFFGKKVLKSAKASYINGK